ncbi:MAG: acetate--CoA ligase family protein [Candidatus Binataceae bacterium]|nr:acetate--CoA ligase family protein [Candidatus Binataceae bacterium]
MDHADIENLIAQALNQGRSVLNEIESKRIVAGLNFPVAIPEPASTAQAAAATAARLGFPAVLKVLSPEIIHKQDAGGVELDLHSEAQVAMAFERIRTNLAARMPTARFDGVAVQPMAPGGVELLIGATRDARFGALITVGLGGIFVELLGDSVTRLAPVSPIDAHAMLSSLRGSAILRGARGGVECDVDAAARLMAGLSELMNEHPAIGEIDLNPVIVHERGLSIVDARIILNPSGIAPAVPSDPNRAARRENLKRAFNPRTVVVIGDKRANSFMWLRSLKALRGQLYSIQIDPAEIAEIEQLGVENRKSLTEIPGPIDLAISAVPRQIAPRILRDCIAARVGAISFFTSGFGETGEEPGIGLEAELRSVALESEIALIGPNCMSLCNPSAGLLNFSGLTPNDGGDVCFISQSGTHTVNFCAQAAARSIQINKAASIGNVTVLEAADYLDLMAEDPATRVIGMYLEGVRDGRRFFDSLSRAAIRHPVVIWKGGVTDSGAIATRSHTGSLQTPNTIWDAVIRQSGAIAAASMDAMLDAIELLARGRPLRGPRMGLVTMTGGQSVVITDTFAAAGLDIPALSSGSYAELKTFFNPVGGSYRNPLDAGGTIDPALRNDNLDRILDILERDPLIDGVVFEISTGLRGAAWAVSEHELLKLLDRLADFNRRSARPFAVILHPAHIEAVVAKAKRLARDRGLVVFNGFEQAAQAFRTSLDYWSKRKIN